MMNRHLTIFIALLLLYSCKGLFGQKIPDPIVKAFNAADVEALSGYFHMRLQVNISDSDYMCSRSQAKEIMREFFTNNKPSSFSIIFEGGKEDSNFSIGTLVTSSGNYRVNIFFRKFEGEYLIHLLRIERDDTKSF